MGLCRIKFYCILFFKNLLFYFLYVFLCLFIVSPVIDSHFFRETATADEGSRTKLMCVVTKGDPPLRFHWLKNGLPFLAHGDTTVQTFEDSSIVTFKRIASGDRGHYTCIVSNMASSTNLTMQLIVNGKFVEYIRVLNIFMQFCRCSIPNECIRFSKHFKKM